MDENKILGILNKYMVTSKEVINKCEFKYIVGEIGNLYTFKAKSYLIRTDNDKNFNNFVHIHTVANGSLAISNGKGMEISEIELKYPFKESNE